MLAATEMIWTAALLMGGSAARSGPSWFSIAWCAVPGRTKTDTATHFGQPRLLKTYLSLQ